MEILCLSASGLLIFSGALRRIDHPPATAGGTDQMMRFVHIAIRMCALPG